MKLIEDLISRSRDQILGSRSPRPNAKPRVLGQRFAVEFRPQRRRWAQRGWESAGDCGYRLVIDDNYISPPRQLQFPTRLFHCSAPFLDRFPSEILVLTTTTIRYSLSARLPFLTRRGLGFLNRC